MWSTFQGALLNRDATKFAANLGVLEDFITQGPTDVASASPTVFPDSLTAWRYTLRASCRKWPSVPEPALR